ncbi:MAG: serine protease [Acidobacteriota bacterium]|nr:serine protease [Acidobacteriota bacterium]
MPTWGHILSEIQTEAQGGNQTPFDTIRHKYIAELAAFTQRNTIVYASRWTTGDVSPALTVINDEDVQGFMQAMYGLRGDSLDLILHTGGGSAEATDAIASYLRAKFRDIRIIIPQAAMSAGTMLACSANKLVMAKHSFIGPIDPQFILQTSIGVRAVAAHAILEQFEKAQEDCRLNPANLNSWLPTLSQYGPALLIECKNQIDFGKGLVEDWLKCFMFAHDPTSTKPGEIAEYLSNHSNFKTHGKHINIVKAKEIGLDIERLEDNQDFQGKVLSAFHATMLTLQTNCVKIIANHNGEAFLKQVRTP